MYSRSEDDKRLTLEDRHKILREIYRHYLDFESWRQGWGSQAPDRTSRDVITVGVETAKGSGKYVDLNISFSDLKDGLNELALRKREAFFYNVILDWKQKDVADHMGITTVSVGQYVEAACRQLAKRYFAEEEEDRTLTN